MGGCFAFIYLKLWFFFKWEVNHSVCANVSNLIAEGTSSFGLFFIFWKKERESERIN